jgi:hypothetical protein
MKIKVFVLIISGVILLTGCPGSNPAEYFDIRLSGDNIEYGTFTVSPRPAARNSTVTITGTPKAGHTLWEPTVTEHGFPLPITRVTGKPYEWTFRMPRSDVAISARFQSISEAVIQASWNLDSSSSWDDFNTANDLIKKWQAFLGPGATSNDDFNQAVDRIAGRISQKMRSEGMTTTAWGTWFPLPAANRPSYSIDTPETLGVPLENRTHLYYIMGNMTSAPALSMAGTGWELGSRTDWPVGADPIGPVLRVQSQALTYRLGENAGTVEYHVFFVPVAQYVVQYGTGITPGTVNITEFSNPHRWLDGPLPPGRRSRNIPWTHAGTTQMSRIGEIGPDNQALGTSTDHLYVRIEWPTDTQRISVTAVPDTPAIVGICTREGICSGASCIGTATPTCGNINGSSNFGHFFPRSRTYNIVVSVSP